MLLSTLLNQGMTGLNYCKNPIASRNLAICRLIDFLCFLQVFRNAQILVRILCLIHD